MSVTFIISLFYKAINYINVCSFLIVMIIKK